MKQLEKNILLVFLCLLVAGKVFCQESMVETFIQQYKNIAIIEMIRTGVPAAISLAQGIEESQAGTGWLALHANNQFGIKCKSSWQGETVRYDDDHNNECFRKYVNDSSSWRDHSNFLKTMPRYAFLFYLDPLDYKAWAYGLKDAGYATNKKYAKKLIHLIQTYDLQQYSERALALRKEATPQSEFAILLDKKVKEDQRKSGIAESAQTTNETNESAVESTYPAGAFRINNRKVLYLPQGTHLISIAEKYQIRLNKLLRYNEITNETLDKDMLIYLQKKKKTGLHDLHIVAPQESMHEIAQEEGIRLKWLYKRNLLEDDENPSPGTKLALQGHVQPPESEHATAMNSPQSHSDNSSSGGFWNWIKGIFSGNPKPELHEQQPKKIVQHALPEAQVSVKRKHTNSFQKENKIIHQVESGETLYSISHKYGITVAQLRKINQLTDDKIFVGQKLIIPKD